LFIAYGQTPTWPLLQSAANAEWFPLMAISIALRARLFALERATALSFYCVRPAMYLSQIWL
jgi:hypothetical protein